MNRSVKPVKRRRRQRVVTTQDRHCLRRRRIEAGLTIRQLAARAGVGVGSICDLENGYQSALPPTLAALARALECEIRDLLPPEHEAVRPELTAGSAA